MVVVDMEKLRTERKKKLDGKYIIILDSESRGLLYIQCKEFSKGRYYWSQFMSNARPFNTEQEAIDWCQEHNIKGVIKKVDKNLKVILY